MTGTSTSKAVVSGEDLSSSQNQSSAIKTSTRAIIAHHASTGFAWLFVFLPALAYYVHHFVIFGGHVGYPVITSSIDVYNGQDGINIMKELLYIDESSADLEGSEIDTKTPRTKTPVQVLLTQHVEMVLDGFQSLAGPTWIHDDELGRGYLLFSDVGANRIWRWEVGESFKLSLL